ncbi:LuxR family transcriptional regulator [Erwinia sp. MMLR14_017]|jgi:LuxR family quorum-sensing system transcriptional regulator ExpR|uniref:LuxR family transcriptional regulator n=1 Tax=Erwinia sp. MMLR14_017 TaxID=3093842 RepID=UPI0029902935|nr:LuxR family transcriptional regulator [Erwinia sp. MMLR14_017]MDW8845616.1 LuxR family transcriptional regulator [Erwinia sp. MMLR14_017]
MENENYVNSVIKKHLETKLKELGDFIWAYVVLSKNNMSISAHATNYPDKWVEYYQENNLQFTDPVVITALNRLTPFSWNEKINLANESFFSSIFEKAKLYSIISGYTFVLHDYKKNLVTLSLLIDPAKREETERLINLHKGTLDLLLASVHEEYLALISLSKTNDSHLVNENIFTTRENEILYWASVGKTYSETGTILGIKTTTVKFHMSNIVKKLGVTNARHAVRLGIELHLVRPVS